MEDQICQSCAMPLNKSNKGTNNDNTQNEEYCHFCFLKGEYTHPQLTLEQQKSKLISMAVTKMNFSEEKAISMVESVLQNLKRWK